MDTLPQNSMPPKNAHTFYHGFRDAAAKERG